MESVWKRKNSVFQTFSKMKFHEICDCECSCTPPHISIANEMPRKKLNSHESSSNCGLDFKSSNATIHAQRTLKFLGKITVSDFSWRIVLKKSDQTTFFGHHFALANRPVLTTTYCNIFLLELTVSQGDKFTAFEKRNFSVQCACLSATVCEFVAVYAIRSRISASRHVDSLHATIKWRSSVNI